MGKAIESATSGFNSLAHGVLVDAVGTGKLRSSLATLAHGTRPVGLSSEWVMEPQTRQSERLSPVRSTDTIPNAWIWWSPTIW